MKRHLIIAAVLCLLLFVAAAPATDKVATVSFAPERDVTVELPNGTKLVFLLDGEYLLGLQEAEVDGTPLSSSATVLKPLLAQEFADGRMIWPAMKFKDSRTDGRKVVITCTLMGATDEEVFRSVFVYAGDRGKALGEAITPELAKLKQKRDRALEAFDPALAKREPVIKAVANLEKWNKKLAEAKPARKKSLQIRVERAEQNLQNVKATLRPVVAAADEALAGPWQTVETFEKAVAERAMEVGHIHRDFYRFAHLQQPAELASVSRQKRFAALGGKLKEAGTLRWVIEPEVRNIGGWEWVGWKQHYEFELPQGRKVNALRQIGTWELGGTVDGLTLVNLRYRGLGRIEHAFQTRDEAVVNPFTTTEIMPGAVGGGYAVSPVIPRSHSKELTDRGYALKHRVAAWIAHMARGAGHGFVDYQYRDGVAMCSFFAEQGNLRALTEAFPGDRVVSQTDEEFFALTRNHGTIPQSVLVLRQKGKRDKGFWRNRWMEADQHVRDQVSEDLKFVQFEASPGVGILSDAGWAGYYKSLAEGDLDAWADKGVRMIAYHNPGWINGRYQGPDGPKRTGGGVCNIYDWWPTKDVEQPWAAFQKACAKRKVAFYPWLGQTQWKEAPFCRRVGFQKEHWTLNTPFDDHGPGYGPMNLKTNALNAESKAAFVGRLESVREKFGYQGFWADSFQNLFMSQLGWSDGEGNSLQRTWWEQIAWWTRQGVGWMGESHSFPGLSCSIEVAGWEKDMWYFQHVWKWLRGNEQNHFRGEQLDEMCFRAMAVKGWVAPDHSYKTHANFAIPSFKRLAGEFSAARPTMRRPYVLPDEKGMLWLPYSGDKAGVLFAMEDIEVPSGVGAAGINEEGGSAKTLRKLHTYRVSGSTLLEAFGIPAPPRKDPRLGREYKAPEYTWKVKE